MSGVFGVATTTNYPVGERARLMGQRMRHLPHLQLAVEQPDVQVAAGWIGLGLLQGRTPVARSIDDTVWLWLCGEFYHRPQLAGGDLDDPNFALQTYLRAGGDGLASLDGAFTALIWDARVRRIVLVNDRYGLYQHCYAVLPNMFIFAPEIKALLSAPELPQQLDTVAVAQYVRFQQLLGERTWIKAVQLQEPATILEYNLDDGQLRIRKYWDWEMIQPIPEVSFEEAVDGTTARFQRAINAMSTPPLRVGVYLSGGLDARLILAFLSPELPVTTITYGAPGGRDVVYAGRLARRARSKHHWFPFLDGRWVIEQAPLHLALTEGMHSWMHAHGMSTLEEARKHIDVNLSGWDGGTILGGYLESYKTDRQKYHLASEEDLTQRLFEDFCQRFAWPGLEDSEADELFGEDPAQLSTHARASFQQEFQRTTHYPRELRSLYFYILQHVRRSTQSMVIFGRSAFEVRCPFFDYQLVEWIYGLPAHIRNTPHLQRAVLTRRAPQLAMVPYDKDDRLPHSNPLVREPHALMQRGKSWINRHIAPIFRVRPRLYADYENYLRHELRVWAEDILFDLNTRQRGLFNQPAVDSLWRRHLRGDELWTIGKVAPLITLELVQRQLIDSSPDVIGGIPGLQTTSSALRVL